MGEVITGYGEEAGLCGHDGSIWIKVKVDADGHLQVDGISTALPTNAATATNQTTMITALQLIDDLRNALGSVNTDDLQVDVKTTGNPSNLDIALSTLRDALAGTSPNTSTLYALGVLLTEIQARLGDETAPATGSVNKQLADLLTELGQKLETADLNLDGTKDLQVDVKTSALPTDAATATNQTTMITALQLIDDLRNALGSVATDSLLARLYGWDTTAWQKVRTDVNGYTLVRVWSSELPDDAATQTTLALLLTELQAKLETADLNLDATKDLQVDVKTMPTTTVQAAGGDKIFSFESIVEQELSNLNLSAGTNTIDGTTVPTGKVWHITQMSILYVGTVPTRVYVLAVGLAGAIGIMEQASPASAMYYPWTGNLYMQAGDLIRVYVEGATAGNDLYMAYAGVQMDAPA